jgi:hypothetical protein
VQPPRSIFDRGLWFGRVLEILPDAMVLVDQAGMARK